MRNVQQAEDRLLLSALNYAMPERLGTLEAVKKSKAELLLAADEYGKAKKWARDKRDAWKAKKRMKAK